MPLHMVVAGGMLPIVLPTRETPESVSELTAPEAELLKHYGEQLLIVQALAQEGTPFTFCFRAE